MDRPFGSANSLLFWISLALLGYVYVGYPIVAWLRATLRPSLRCRAPAEPAVTVIVVAHNEEDRIGPRLENLLALDYPRDRLEIVLASDGSSDETVNRARRYEDAGVRVRAFAERRGKAAVLNDLVPSARGQIVVLADARQRFEPGAVRALVANFADLTVGAVSGELMLAPTRAGAAVGEGACFYWRYEKFIRRSESRATSTVGATGAIYAIRRALFEPIPEDTILDDVLIPLRMIRRGYRTLLEPDARAYDGASATSREEFVRKVRTIAGTFQLFARERWLFDPFRNSIWFETISHKALRLVAPILQLLVLVANVGLADVWVYRWILEAQLLFYTAAVGGYAHRHMRHRLYVLTLPYTICLLNWATIIGFVRFATDRQQATWERVAPTRVPS
jgi:cellulose synthase/poly-beta-1,6-N-acetylglucosamine synthase-like glycosyltransferase